MNFEKANEECTDTNENSAIVKRDIRCRACGALQLGLQLFAVFAGLAYTVDAASAQRSGRIAPAVSLRICCSPSSARENNPVCLPKQYPSFSEDTQPRLNNLHRPGWGRAGASTLACSFLYDLALFFQLFCASHDVIEKVSRFSWGKLCQLLSNSLKNAEKTAG